MFQDYRRSRIQNGLTVSKCFRLMVDVVLKDKI